MGLLIESQDGSSFSIIHTHRGQEKDFLPFEGTRLDLDGGTVTLAYLPDPKLLELGQHYLMLNGLNDGGQVAVIEKQNVLPLGKPVLHCWMDSKGVPTWEPAENELVKSLFGQQEVPRIVVTRT